MSDTVNFASLAILLSYNILGLWEAVKFVANSAILLGVAFRLCWGYPGSSVGKESACNAGDPSSIPGLGRFTGEGIGYSLQYSWASLVAQLVKNLPAMWETWVRSLGWEDPLEEGEATHTSIPAWRKAHGLYRVRYDLVTFPFPFRLC